MNISLPTRAIRRHGRRFLAGLSATAVLCVGNWVLVHALSSRVPVSATGSLGQSGTVPGLSAQLLSGVFGALILVVFATCSRLMLSPATRRIRQLKREVAAANLRAIEQAKEDREEFAELEAQNELLRVQRNELLGVHDTLLFQQDAMSAIQASLEEREARYRSLVEALSEGVILQSADGHVVTWNESAKRILAVSGTQLAASTSSDSAWDAIDEHGQPLRGDQLPIATTIRTGEPQRGVIVGVRCGDGHRRWLSINSQPIQPKGSDALVAAVATFTDITAARESQAELERLSVIVQQSAELVAITDPDGRLSWVNEAWERHTGFTLEEVVGRFPGELLDGPETNTLDINSLKQAAERGERWVGELLNYRKDGTKFWVELTITPIRDASGRITSFFSVERDITERRAAQRERQRLVAALTVTADGVAITSTSGTLEFVNHALARLHGYRPSELIGRPVSMFVRAEELRRVESILRNEVEERGFWNGTITALRKDGTTFPADLSISKLPAGGTVSALRDMTEHVAAKEALQTLSVRDELTGLYNRRGFFTTAKQLLALAQRTASPCVLLYGDLDRFKDINDAYGHLAGDQALQAVAELLRSCLRGTDIVARLGGDEFTVFATDIREEAVPKLLAKIEARFESWNESTDHEWKLAMSLGVARFDPAAPVELESLLKAADVALYEHKRERQGLRAA